MSFVTADEKKVSLFIKSINDEADAQYNKVKDETDAFVASELEAARAAAKENAKAAAKAEVGKISELSNSDIYKSRTQLNMQISQKRNEITNAVFSKAEKEIAQFTQKNEYGEFLIKSVQSIKAAIGDDTVIFIRPEDEKYVSELNKICAGVEFDKTIKLGGCKGCNKTASLRADDTLDSRFEQQKTEFYSYSGLSVIG